MTRNYSPRPALVQEHRQRHRSTCPRATTTAVFACLLLLHTFCVGRASTCSFAVVNQVNASLTIWSYNGDDDSCGLPYGVYKLDANNGTAVASCNNESVCQGRLSSLGLGCDGSALIRCGNALWLRADPSGGIEYCLDANGDTCFPYVTDDTNANDDRRWLSWGELDGNAKDASQSSPRVGTTESASSSLDGRIDKKTTSGIRGTKRSKRIL